MTQLQTPPPLPQLAPGTDQPAPPLSEHPAWIQALLMCALLPLITLTLVTLAAANPLLALGASMTMAMATWVACYRVNSTWLGIELALVLGFAYFRLLPGYAFVPLAVLWIAAAMVAGVIGALLTQRNHFGEDDYFFLPLGAAALCFVLLVGLGLAGSLSKLQVIANDTVKEMLGLMDIQIKQMQSANPSSAPALAEVWQQFQVYPGLYLATMATGFWALGMWLFSRLARRLVGALQGSRPALILFRIQHRYIFLLILGLILEIFIILSKREALNYLVRPVLVVMVVGCFLEGLGVVLFLAAVRRMAGRVYSALWLSVLGVMLALTTPWAIVILGLADIWFDFRKLDKLRNQGGIRL